MNHSELRSIFIIDNQSASGVRLSVLGQEMGVTIYTGGRGYYQAKIRSKILYIHRVIYSIHHGVDLTPEIILDHIDRNRKNNHIGNLRVASTYENAWNSKILKTNTSGEKCLCWYPKKNAWRVFVTSLGKRTGSKYFANKDAAVAWRDAIYSKRT